MSASEQSRLFEEPGETQAGNAFINERCRIQTQDGYRVVSALGVTLAHYAVGDRMGEGHAMVSLVEQGWAEQKEVAAAFGCSDRTVRRLERRFQSGGLAALGRTAGYPKGRPRLSASRAKRVQRWKSEGLSNREIARRLGVSEKAVRKQLRRLGWKGEGPTQSLLPFADADPNLSVPSALDPASGAVAADNGAAEVLPADASGEPSGTDAADPNLSAPSALDPALGAVAAANGAAEVQPADTSGEPSGEGADSNLSAAAAAFPPGVSLDVDPADRRFDRVLACLGLLDDAAPLFAPAQRVPGAGVLLALPALLDSGVLELAREVYGSLGPAFYGLRTTIVTLLLMALLRVKRPEGLKERSPRELGRVLGLDRAPEVKTLRRKLSLLAAYGRATEFGRALARRRVAARGEAMAFLYVDGHVRVYHGKRTIPKTHVARMRICMPATTDYWVNDVAGEPLFVVTSEANAGMVKILPEVLAEVRSLMGDRRVTVAFDRGGWSPKLFESLIAQGFDVLTYRKGSSRRVPKRCFSPHDAVIDGHRVCYVLADQQVRLLKGRLRMRQVTRLSEDGHQTPILTSRQDLPAIEIAYRMFERWRQENFFKYLREEYALDALVDYGVEPADATREVPNPERKRLDAELDKARKELAQLQAAYGLEALENRESLRRTMRGFKIANASLARRVMDGMKRVATLESKRARVPARVPVQQLSTGEVLKLAVERKHLTDLLKMVAYQAESDLVRLVTPHYQRAEDEARTLVQNALAASANLDVDGDVLRVHIEPLNSPHRTRALAALCEQINQTKTQFPGSTLRLLFDVQPEPPTSPAFPGPRPPIGLASTPPPDSLPEG